MAAGQQPVNDDWEDVEWEDTSDPTPAVSQFEVPAQAEEPGFLSRAWSAISEPLTDAPSRFARSIGDWLEAPSLSTAPTGEGGIGDYLRERYAMAKGFGAGALEGIGDLVSGFTSPVNLATTVATGGASTAARAGLPQVARAANLVGKGAGLLTAGHGAGQVLSPETSLAEKGMGLVEMAGGGAAMLHTPTTTPRTSGSGISEPISGPRTGPAARPGETPSTAGKAPTGALSPVKGASPEVAPGVVDKFAETRKVPVGTRYTIKPEAMNRRKMADAIKLGFEYEGLDDSGRIIIRKVRPSPDVRIPEPPQLESNAWAEAANLPRTLMSSMDMSAPLRQGIGLIHKKAFWTALPDMVKAWGSEDAYKGIMQSITDDPIFKRTVNARGDVQPSFAEKAGLQLTDLTNMTRREESIMSSLAERVPGVRRSNRAYTAFLNKLRADTFKQMAGDFGAYSGMDARNNLPLAKSIADFVNTASGRGNLGAAEPAAKVLSSVLFSPRLIASRLGMMGQAGRAVFSPEVYMMQSPSVRREYLKSLAAIAATAGTFTQLARMAGATVETDPASSDFGKVKFGNTRIDPYGGFQQYVVAMQRLMPSLDLSSAGLGEIGGRMKSTMTGREYSLDDSGFGRSTRADVLARFLRSKTNPIINFGWGLMAGQRELSGQPMDLTNLNPMENSIAQRFLPMLSQDIYDLVQSEETPLPAKGLAAFLASVGMGSQTYGNER